MSDTRVRGAALALALALACGDDEPAPPPIGVDAGDAGSAGAGAGANAGGSGGAGAAAGSAGAGSTGPCQPGETRACQRELFCMGEQTCLSDGSYGECTCSSVPLEGTGIVGAACESDADCAGGAWCMTPLGNDYLGGGGPAGGYCTFDCEETTDCEARDSQSRCVPAGPDDRTVCLRTCLSKDPEPGEAKCLNRPTLMCNSAAAAGVEPFGVQRQDGLCLPRCGSDADCPARRVCHRQGGVCTERPPPGSPSGSRCERDNDCDGQMCEDRSDGVGTCTALCVVGALSGCGFATSAPLRDAACLSPLVAASGFSEGSGDAGLCRELCEVDTDCQRAADGFVCRPLGEGAAAFFGRSGACAPP